ncbi:MAG: winged helix-turn-helix transcriptional regulator [Hyphomicrobiales bacterium]|nr:winged helix-turn-helix transcriptional regulator [Hyphomicrobiales bacterium]
MAFPENTCSKDPMARALRVPRGATDTLTVSRPQLLSRGSDRTFRQFVHDTLAFSARIQAIRNALGGAINLSGPQYTILIAIARNQPNNPVGINHIAEQLHLSPPFVTIEVNKLVAARLITKRANTKDRRRVVLTITPKARTLLRWLTSIQRPANDVLFESLSSDDFAHLRRKMPEMVASADRALRLFRPLVQKRQRARRGAATLLSRKDGPVG